jgi:phosphoesterase RecJ-like protein
MIYNDEFYARLNTEYKAIFKAIKKADRIVVFRHEDPDFDAFGTQMGLVTWLKDSFPQKTVHFVGEGFHSFTPRIFPMPETATPDFYQEPYLAIVVDTPTKARISMADFSHATQIIRIDHHPEVEKWGDLTCIHPEMAAASEVVALMIESIGHHYPLSKEAARYFFIGIVGDSGRFRYPEVSPLTFRLTADLLQTGIDKEAIYSQMYMQTLAEFNFQKWVLTHYTISPAGTAYYVLTQKDLDELGLESGDGKLGLDLFRNVEGISSVLSVTEDTEKKNFRLSFRSETKIVSKVAALFNGGGHDFAAGGRVESLSQVKDVVRELDNLQPVSAGK